MRGWRADDNPNQDNVMAHKKGGGSTRNGRDSNPQYRGVKAYGGQFVTAGSIIIRQCGSNSSGTCPAKDRSAKRPVTDKFASSGLSSRQRPIFIRTRSRAVTPGNHPVSLRTRAHGYSAASTPWASSGSVPAEAPTIEGLGVGRESLPVSPRLRLSPREERQHNEFESPMSPDRRRPAVARCLDGESKLD